jgi:hypothetical protein
VYSGSHLDGKRFADDEEIETEVRKWLRLVKRWYKRINVGGGYVEKQMFFPWFEYRILYGLCPFVTYLREQH